MEVNCEEAVLLGIVAHLNVKTAQLPQMEVTLIQRRQTSLQIQEELSDQPIMQDTRQTEIKRILGLIEQRT